MCHFIILGTFYWTLNYAFSSFFFALFAELLTSHFLFQFLWCYLPVSDPNTLSLFFCFFCHRPEAYREPNKTTTDQTRSNPVTEPPPPCPLSPELCRLHHPPLCIRLPHQEFIVLIRQPHTTGSGKEAQRFPSLELSCVWQCLRWEGREREGNITFTATQVEGFPPTWAWPLRKSSDYFQLLNTYRISLNVWNCMEKNTIILI